MNREDIIRMAQEAKFEQVMHYAGKGHIVLPDALFIKFAQLVAEDCAKRCEDVANDYQKERMVQYEHGSDMAAAAIREAYKP